MITFTHTHENMHGEVVNEIVYKVHEEGNLHDLMQDFRRFLLAVSYQPGSIDQYIEAE